MGKKTIVEDNDLSDGCSASFDIPTGIYKITSIAYNQGIEIDRNMVIRVFYLNR